MRLWPFFASRQEAGAVVGKRAGEDRHNTSALSPISPGWDNLIAHGTTDHVRDGKPGKIRRWSAVRPSFPRLVSNDSHRAGIIRARLP